MNPLFSNEVTLSRVVAVGIAVVAAVVAAVVVLLLSALLLIPLLVCVVCWLLNVPATCKCISGTGLLRQFYVLPH